LVYVFLDKSGEGGDRERGEGKRERREEREV
jgi:hypothetical protein